jgi:hypothetical protein
MNTKPHLCCIREMLLLEIVLDLPEKAGNITRPSIHLPNADQAHGQMLKAVWCRLSRNNVRAEIQLGKD